jgi:hypothetical protein
MCHFLRFNAGAAGSNCAFKNFDDVFLTYEVIKDG